MASSSSSSMSHIISEEEFFAFHSIDRLLFYRLVFSMGHDPSEAMQVSAFWLWLEKINMAQYVVNILNFQDTILEIVFKESLLCLRVAESDDSSMCFNDVPLVHRIVGTNGNRIINLKFIHENRICVLLGVGNIIQEVCLRAFRDLIQTLMASKPLNGYTEYTPLTSVDDVGDNQSNWASGFGCGVGGGIGGLKPTTQQPPLSPVYEQNFRDYPEGVVNHPGLIRVGDFSVPLKSHYDVSNHNYLQEGGIGSSNNVPMVRAFIDNNYEVESQTQVLERDLVDFLAKMQLSKISQSWNQMVEEERNSVPSERTIFLTFSKGYPIYEYEVREFLNRTFGDIIEALQMQEVPENEQSLYARLVVRNSKAMELVLTKHGRSKFSINGKHVWARKYVRKNPASSPPSSPSKKSYSKY